MDWLSWLKELIEEISRLGEGAFVPASILFAVMVVRLLRLNQQLMVNPPLTEASYTLELLRQILCDRWFLGTCCVSMLWFLAYQVAVYPWELISIVLNRQLLRYVLPYGVPLATFLILILVSHRWRWSLASIIAAAAVSPIWVYSYWHWINPAQPTAPGRIGIWVGPLKGQEHDPRFIEFFAKLQRAGAVIIESPDVKELRQSLERASLREEAGQAQELALKAGARTVVWLEVGEEGVFPYATFRHKKTPYNWDMPSLQLVDLHETRNNPEMMIRFLLGMSYLDSGNYAESVHQLIKTQTPSFPQSRIDIAYAYIAFVDKTGDPKHEKYLWGAANFLTPLLKASGDKNVIRGQANFLLGRICSALVDFGKTKSFFDDHRQYGFHSREDALKAAVQFFNKATTDFSPEGSPPEYGLTFLALGKALSDSDPLLGDLEERARSAKVALEQALALLKGPETRIEYGLARLYLAQVFLAQAMFESDESKEKDLHDRAIQNCNDALQVFDRNEYPELYVYILDTIATLHLNSLSILSEGVASETLDVLRDERTIAKDHQLQSSFNNAEVGICRIASEFNSPKILEDGEDSCKLARLAFRETDAIQYAEATVGLGDLMQKISKIRLAGFDPLTYVRSARNSYVEALNIYRQLPQTPFIRMKEETTRSSIANVSR